MLRDEPDGAGLSTAEAPLRAELFSVSQLEQHARALAGRRAIDPARRGPDKLLSRLADNEVSLRKAYALETEAVARGRRIPPAAEWFIDNYYLIEEQVRTARRHLPRGYSRELPRLANGPTAGMPRVYDIAIELISHSHGRVDRESLRAFVSAYQSVQPLRLGELWAIPIMLRLALLENLRRVVAGVTAGRADRERARHWVERMLAIAVNEPAKVVLVLAEMVKQDLPLSDAFITEFATRLQGQGSALLFPISWLEQRLAERGQTVEHVFQVLSQTQAADQVAIGNSIGSLRFLGATDWRDFVEAMSVVERTLGNDPARVYGSMDFATRDSYRHVVEAIARRGHLGEDEVARAAVDLAGSAGDGHDAHVGYFLVGEGRDRLERAVGIRRGPFVAARRLSRRSRLLVYGGAVTSLTVAGTALFAHLAPAILLPAWVQASLLLLLAIATSQPAVAIVEWAATALVTPRLLPRLDFSKGIPHQQQTLVAVPTLLTDPEEIDGLLESLEVRHLGNRDPELAFALVTDFRDAAEEKLPGDAALLRRACDGIDALNSRHAVPGHPKPFYLLHRPRRWNEREGVWMGWERKRGKLEELNAALRGDASRFCTIVGDLSRLQSVKYVIALDSDTELPRDAARALAGAMAHPLNRPRFDLELGRVDEGYSILQPRVAVTMASARRSRFASLHAGEPGIDPYTRAISDVYQDVFDEGSFIGKGIYDVDAFRKATAGRLPDDRVLSHDLLEGALARAGHLSDVLLFEDYPSSYAADASRRSRWMRGDWQIAAWLGRRVPAGGGNTILNPLSWLSQWKILDNLRRSLQPLALLALLVIGWIAGMAAFSSAVVAAILVLPGFIAAAADLARRPPELPRSRHAGDVARDFSRELVREGLALACLPCEAYLSASAILTTAWRLLFTRRKLLEWRTAADAQRAARAHLAGAYLSMWVAPAMAIAATVALLFGQRGALPLAAPVLALWALAPALAFWVSRPLSPGRHHLAANDVAFLRRVARRTWRFFETFVVAADNHLPPDNFQEDPPQGVAHRTSPTNIGLSLTANLAAYDFGYLCAGDLIERSALTLGSLDKLQRYRTHFCNWYDTRTLEPLRPMYVSTVDSGNLAGHLLTLAAGLHELAGHPLFRCRIFDGLADTVEVMSEGAPASPEVAAALARLRRELAAAPRTIPAARQLLQRLAGEHERLVATLVDGDAEGLRWADTFEAQRSRALDELVKMAPWVELPAPPAGVDGLAEALAWLDRGPTLAETAALEQSLAPPVDRALALAAAGSSADALVPWLSRLREAIRLAAARAAERLSDLRQLAARCSELADLDYEFLYDRDRHLLAIGYNVAERRLDGSFYDLLASEARLGSFVAISQGKLPQEHWFSLGRLLTTAMGKPALLSWSGSMFEYLMPLLVMPTFPGTILDQTCGVVVKRQIEFGREHGVPWGVSESGYSKTDAQLNYQYRAFGVPGLGFKRGLADDVVVAPYASALALMVDPEAACANLKKLAREGQLAAYGFYEAIDYTAARLPRGRESVTVRSYMAHHEGMSFLALAHLLLDRPMQRRFESDPSFRATELLLQERVPRTPSVEPHPAESSSPGTALTAPEQNLRVFSTPSTPTPQVQLLSNGSYHVAVTNAGGGYSRWRGLAVTRWHEDPTRDAWGSFCYLRDVTTGDFWSVAHQPSLRRAKSYQAIFSLGRAEFRRRDGDIDTHVEISVSPEDDVELRRISLTNRGPDARTIELTSFAEVVLAPAAADAAHPAFSNLFVQTELIRERQAILCTRRPRSGGETPPWMLHSMTVYGAQLGASSYETRREEFIGRCRSAEDPAAMHRPRLDDGQGAVLDPVVAIRNTVLIQPDETVRIHLVTGVAETRSGAVALVEKYADRHSADRVFELSWTHSQVLLRRLDATEADTLLYERLVSNVLYASATMRAAKSVMAKNRRGQSALWPYSISGDLPIALVRIADRERLALVRQMVQAHAYWRRKGVAADLMIWNEDSSGYRQALQDEILAIVAAASETGTLDQPGGIFLRRSDQMSEEDKVLLQTVARLIVSDSEGTLAEQVNRRPPAEAPLPLFVARSRRDDHAAPAAPPAALVERSDLAAFNGKGGFTHDGREYVIITGAEARTPAPWVNVLANPYFGTVVSESGGAYTWCENAHGYRLTPWRDDPVSDASGEAFYVRDQESGRYWSPTPLPAPDRQPYTTRHGFGYSVFEHERDGIVSELQTFVATDAPLKFMVFKLRNRSGRTRRLSLTGLFELVLGEHRAGSAPHVVSELDPASRALFARNAWSSEFAARVAFLDCSEEQRSVSADRLELVGRNGSLVHPACMTRARLSGRAGAGLDPCLGMQVDVDLADGEEREIAFTFGSGRDLGDARTLVYRFRGIGPARAALENVWSYWNRTLGTVHVQTPDASLDFLANGWLLYQVLASRLWGRSGFYQSGGAFGFRDQLQDAMALVHAAPALLREQILLSAAHQFREGDVQHWWHPPLGRGVRTRISDDSLFLPSAVCRYVAAVGDTGVLDENVRFLEGRVVKADEDSYYDLPSRSEESATVYEHCVRAIRKGLHFGEHGLPLMGSGDWNDGMNLVGDKGKGESVWLAFFLYDVLVRFGALARQRQDAAFAELCAGEATRLRANIEAHAWDGEWYRRAYFDDGSPLGSSSNPECQIDSLPQSWAVLSGAADKERALGALASVDRRLVRRDLRLIQLFDPPFDSSPLEPGYVKGYVPGVRENGGQYTHAAVWAVMAFAAAGDVARAWELFGLINPVHHGDDAKSIETYRVEPYVAAADVYTNPQHAGRGGWTWYTGSAAWMYRLAVESLLGLHLEVDRLRVEPLMPASWPAFDVHYRYRNTVHHIHVRNLGGGGRDIRRVVCDGIEQPEGTVPLRDDGVEHHAEVEIGGRP